MMVKLWRILALTLILSAMISIAYANVLTISPSSPGDWSWMANCHKNPPSAKAYFTKGGPAPAEGNPFPTGNGGFYASLAWHGDDGETQTDSAWLGLDRHNNQDLAGIPLKKIKTLSYTAYNAGMYNWKGGTPERRYCGQPFILTLTVRDPAGNRRQFWYRPWGYGGWLFWNNRRAWLDLDAVNMTSVPDFARTTEGLPDHPGAPVWYEVWSDATFSSWSELINNVSNGLAYGDWTLVPTSTTYDPTHTDPLGWKSPGWDAGTTPPGDPRTTGTGKCVNLWVGARKAADMPFGGWVAETAGFKGYVDSFTMGVDYGSEQSPNIVETTYDFASDGPAPMTVAVCNAGQSRWGSNPPVDFPYANYNPTIRNQDLFTYKFFGKVTAAGIDEDTLEFWFTIWDASYARTSIWADPKGQVKVVWPWNESPTGVFEPWTWPIQVGDWVSAQGFLYDAWYFQVKPPAEMTSSPSKTVRYAPIFE